MTDRSDCPHCGAALDWEDLRARGLSHCGTCGETIDALTSITTGGMSEIPFRGNLSFPITPPPAASGIQIVQASDDGIVMTIPGGKKGCASLGCFSVIWLTITSTVTGGFLVAAIGGDAGEIWPVFLFLSIFWAVGLGMAYLALKMRFTRGYLSLQPERAAMQTIFLGNKKTTETRLNAVSQVAQSVSYTENNRSVFRVEIAGSDQVISFGTGWEQDAKDWCVNTIRAFLQYHYPPMPAPQGAAVVSIDGETIDVHIDPLKNNDQCLDCGGMLWNLRETLGESANNSTYCPTCRCHLLLLAGQIKEGHSQRRLSPEELSPDSRILAEKGTGGNWEISHRIRDELVAFYSGCMVMFGLVWILFPISIISLTVPPMLPARIFGAIIGCLIAVPGLIVLALGMFARWGKVRVILGPDRCSVRWSVGPLGYSRSFPIESLNSVKLVRGTYMMQKKSRTPSTHFPLNQVCCILDVAGSPLPVTFGQNPNLSRDVSALIRFALDDLGIRLPNE